MISPKEPKQPTLLEQIQLSKQKKTTDLQTLLQKFQQGLLSFFIDRTKTQRHEQPGKSEIIKTSGTNVSIVQQINISSQNINVQSLSDQDLKPQAQEIMLKKKHFSELVKKIELQNEQKQIETKGLENQIDLQSQQNNFSQRLKEMKSKYESYQKKKFEELKVPDYIKCSAQKKFNQIMPPKVCTLIKKSIKNSLSDKIRQDYGYIHQGQGIEPQMRQGFGILCDQQENVVYSGYWQDDQYHGPGILINTEAEQIDGPFDYAFLNLIKNGWIRFEGGFNRGMMHGEGALTLTNGEKFHGRFENGTIEGVGAFFPLDDYAFEGFWRDGVLQQEDQ